MIERVLILVLVTGTVLTACRPPADGAAADLEKPLFTDVAASSGLDFVHRNGMSGELYFSEMSGAGGAFFDYDNDGDLDVYAVQGHPLGKAAGPAAASPPSGDRLYRNDLAIGADGKPILRFTDVTTASGLAAHGYGMGVATGDYDNDGFVDVYVANFGDNELWRNQGDGTFRDVTAAAAAGDGRWSIGASFFDYDRDGWLDLFVVNYVDYRLETHKPCLSQGGSLDYCGPQSFAPAPDRLLRNRGDGTFEDVSQQAGILAEPGSGLGAVTADFDGDGWVDIYVANDLMRNDLWMNHGDGTFTNEALYAGCAVDLLGRAQASMGVDAGDLDGDGDFDLFMTHLINDTNTVYWNEGGGLFRDGTAESQLGPPSVAFTGFGTGLFDYDNDGWLDVVVANGAVTHLEALRLAGDPFPLHQVNQLFHNQGGGVFAEVSHRAPVFALSEVSRGVALGDVDNDGDPDVLVFNNNGPVRLLRNEVGQEAHWLGLRLVAAMDGGARRDQLGAVAEVVRDGKPALVQRVRTDGSYASASDPRVLFGLGREAGPVRLRVRWPDGQVEEWPELAADRYHELVQGSSQVAKESL